MNEKVAALDASLIGSVHANEQSPVSMEIVPKYRFIKVKDGRGREIDRLWVRNGRFYYQLWIAGKGCRRIPLVDEHNQPVKTLTQAEEAIERLKRNKREGELPRLRRAPAFDEYVEHYLSWLEQTEAKKPKTRAQENCTLRLVGKALWANPPDPSHSAGHQDTILVHPREVFRGAV